MYSVSYCIEVDTGFLPACKFLFPIGSAGIAEKHFASKETAIALWNHSIPFEIRPCIGPRFAKSFLQNLQTVLSSS